MFGAGARQNVQILEEERKSEDDSFQEDPNISGSD